MNYLEIYEKISKIGDTYELRGDNETFLKGFNTCLFMFKKAFKESPSLNLAFENKKLVKELEKKEKEHNKEINRLKIELDNEAHRYAQLEKEKVVTKTVIKNVKIKEPDSNDIVLLEFGFKKPLKINTKADVGKVNEVLAKVINGRIKNSRDYYNEKNLRKELISALNKEGFKSQII